MTKNQRQRFNKVKQRDAFEPKPNEMKDPNQGGKVEKINEKTYIIKKK